MYSANLIHTLTFVMDRKHGLPSCREKSTNVFNGVSNQFVKLRALHFFLQTTAFLMHSEVSQIVFVVADFPF